VLNGSSHGEAPGTKAHPQIDGTDLYAFMSYETGRQDFVTIIANYYPGQDGYGGPNFYALAPDTMYEIHIDNTGDAVEDMTFQFQLTSELGNHGKGAALKIHGHNVPVALKVLGPVTAGDNSALNFFEFYRLHYVTKAGTKTLKPFGGKGDTFVKPFDYAGNKTFPDYLDYANQYIYDVAIPSCSAGHARVFVGQRHESFHINIGPIFDLVNFVPIEHSHSVPSGIKQNHYNNFLRRKNIDSFAIEVPIKCLVGKGNGVIGVWTVTRDLKTKKQVSRLANPLVNELIIGLPEKDKFNAASPAGDKQFMMYFQYPTLPEIVSLLFANAVNSILGTSFTDIAPSKFPREDLIAVFLTGIKSVNQLKSHTVKADMLRLSTNIQATPYGSQVSLGLIGGDNAGYPNGRRPTDDIIDIALRVMMGLLCETSLFGCVPTDAPVGTLNFTDGAPVTEKAFYQTFPYLTIPVPGNKNPYGSEY